MQPTRTCSFDGCERPSSAHGLCSTHANQLRKHGKLTPFKGMGDVRICVVDGCDRLVHSGKFCSLHRQRIARHGAPTVVIKSTGGQDPRTDANGVPLRFIRSMKRTPAGCLEWTGRLNRDGYAYFRIDNELISFHRYMYRKFVGPLHDGTEVDHLCNNRACGEPKHLEQVSQAENKRRAAARMQTCRNGLHPWVEENIYHHGGEKKCKQCHLAAARRYRMKKLNERARTR